FPDRLPESMTTDDHLWLRDFEPGDSTGQDDHRGSVGVAVVHVLVVEHGDRSSVPVPAKHVEAATHVINKCGRRDRVALVVPREAQAEFAREGLKPLLVRTM